MMTIEASGSFNQKPHDTILLVKVMMTQNLFWNFGSVAFLECVKTSQELSNHPIFVSSSQQRKMHIICEN